ncbi:integrase catalytic region [Candidatus Magnetoovum chiemensis]|nr:integrase catalytic region [Candidatus Magnetoovum chiemensis]
MYLSVIIDLFSRMVVGWAMQETMTAAIVKSALLKALRYRKHYAGLIFHSDRGSQYASYEFSNLLKANGIIASMSRKGDCYDNAVSESFFHTLKTELVHRQKYETKRQAKSSVFEYIEGFYNLKRKHSSIDYLSPIDFERTKKVA